MMLVWMDLSFSVGTRRITAVLTFVVGLFLDKRVPHAA